MTLRITAAIPTFRRPEKFRRALLSVLAQTVPADQIVIGDDGADDEVRRIVDSVQDGRINYVSRAPQVRMTENWNFVMKWADDGFVALLEDDNFWISTHLESAHQILSRFPEAGIYHAGHREAWDYNGELEFYKSVRAPWHDELVPAGGGLVRNKDVIFDALTGGSINSSTVVVKRSVLELVPEFDHRYLMGMDTLMWARVALASSCVYSPTIGAVYTYHGGNVSTGEVRSRRAGSQVRASRRILLHEALTCDGISLVDLEDFALSLPAPQVAGLVTMLAHSSTSADVREMVRRVWRLRRNEPGVTRYVRASRFAGFGILAHVDFLDSCLGLLGGQR